jgi:hypothetical protein
MRGAPQPQPNTPVPDTVLIDIAKQVGARMVHLLADLGANLEYKTTAGRSFV